MAEQSLSQRQIDLATTAGAKLLRLPTTLIPGDMRAEVDVLELLLSNMAAGVLRVVSTVEPPVELGSNKADLTDADIGINEDGKAPATDEDARRDNSERETTPSEAYRDSRNLEG